MPDQTKETTMSMTMRAITLLAATLLLAAGLVVLRPAVAQAQSVEHRCTAGQVCLFEWSDFRRSIAGYAIDRNNYRRSWPSGSCVGGDWDVWHFSYKWVCTRQEQARVDRNATSVDNDGQTCHSVHHIRLNNDGPPNLFLSRGVAITRLSGTFNEALRSHDWCG